MPDAACTLLLCRWCAHALVSVLVFWMDCGGRNLDSNCATTTCPSCPDLHHAPKVIHIHSAMLAVHVLARILLVVGIGTL